MNTPVDTVLKKRTPFQISFFLHVLAVVIFILSNASDWGAFLKQKKKVSFEVIEVPAVAPPNLKLQPQNINPPKAQPKPAENTQKVFGVSRKALTTSTATENTVESKLGNTVAKENDDLTLKPGDADSLPIPAEQYLLSKRAGYAARASCSRTDQARASGLVGVVRVAVLIGTQGEILEMKALNELGEGLKERALECISKSRFYPGEIEGKAVVTRETIAVNFKAVD